VDHIVPLARGGTNDAMNLQTLCGRCHSTKTATRDGGYGRGASV
jgi:5-methylcytosine-specific restriction endonuclease McrA